MSKKNRNPKNETPANLDAEGADSTNPAAIVSAPQDSAQTGETAPTVGGAVEKAHPREVAARPDEPCRAAVRTGVVAGEGGVA